MYLTHVRRAVGQVKHLKLLGDWIEADYHVPSEVAQPYDVSLINIQSVGPRVRPGELPLLPVATNRVVDRDLTRVPLAYPDLR